MIDREMLKDLGWSNELIDEILRGAELIRQSSVRDLATDVGLRTAESHGASHIQLYPQMSTTAEEVRVAH